MRRSAFVCISTICGKRNDFIHHFYFLHELGNVFFIICGYPYFVKKQHPGLTVVGMSQGGRNGVTEMLFTTESIRHKQSPHQTIVYFSE